MSNEMLARRHFPHCFAFYLKYARARQAVREVELEAKQEHPEEVENEEEEKKGHPSK